MCLFISDLVKCTNCNSNFLMFVSLLLCEGETSIRIVVVGEVVLQNTTRGKHLIKSLSDYWP